uniref:DUF7138 domain-containing protein n=1 Tax=Davidia involucrata TaxID=16924 RepID=A0A5B7AJZ8_DAVIN
MVESGGGVPLPVVFFDGEREINIGNVKIHPSLEFKNFQSVLSQKIGISPNQISVYLVDRKKPKSAPEDRRKIPITGKVNFSAITREKDCFFLVVLKRSRRERRRKPKQGAVEFSDYLPENKWSPSPEKLLLLRRNQPELNVSQVSGYVSPYYNQITPSEFVDFNSRLQNLQIGREQYLMMESNFNLNSSVNSNLDLESFPRIEDSYAVSTMMTNNRALCEECTSAERNGQSAPFHCCIYDAVTVGFRSQAGPIARPPKASH